MTYRVEFSGLRVRRGSLVVGGCFPVVAAPVDLRSALCLCALNPFDESLLPSRYGVGHRRATHSRYAQGRVCDASPAYARANLPTRWFWRCLSTAAVGRTLVRSDSSKRPPMSDVQTRQLDVDAGTGYWLLGADGHIYPFGSVSFHGSLGSLHLNERVAAITTVGAGTYGVVTEHGGVVTFGGAPFYGSTGGLRPESGAVIAIASYHDGEGYWLLSSGGELYAFGDAPEYQTPLLIGRAVVGAAGQPGRHGLWVVEAGGHIHCLGRAPFHGSLQGVALNAPVVGICATADGDGYYLVAGDGGVFSFGTGRFFGSLADSPSPSAVIGIAATPTCDGYWVAQADGTVTAFGSAPDLGKIDGDSLPAPVVAIAASRG